MDFIRENLGTIITGLVVLAVLILIIANQIKNVKQGKHSCSCGCSRCPNEQMCHKK